MEAALAIKIAIFAGFLFCIIVHECAHALVASWCGDDTAVLQGRLTLNPLPHIDPFMSILLPGALLLSGAPVFGGAKPVPVVMQNLRHPLRDMMWVALAGPVSNMLLALIFAFLINLVAVLIGWNKEFALNYAVYLAYLVQINLLLAFFNLIPIPPLDGSRILAAFLPPRHAMVIYEYQTQAIGMLLVALLVIAGGTAFLIPIISWATGFLFELTDLSGWTKLVEN